MTCIHWDNANPVYLGVMICPEMAFACMTLEPAAEAIDEGTYEGKVTYSPKFNNVS